MLIRGSDAAFILFDMSKESSLSETDYWIKAAKDNAKPTSKSFLIGNKSDLQAKISSEEIIDYATEKNLIFLDISVKGNLKIEFLFELLAKELDF